MIFLLSITIGIALIAVPLLFNWAFASLAKQFEYPEILRQPTVDVLAKFRLGGHRLVLTWWAFAMSALLFGIIAAVLPFALPIAIWQQVLISAMGVLAALVQFLGLIRWPFMVPYLAREAESANQSQLVAIDVVFQSFNRYLGVAVGEHLGYLLTGLWTLALGLSITPLGEFATVLGFCAVPIGAILAMCALEFVGKNEEQGWKLAGLITPFVYIAWSLWLVALGIDFLIQI